MSRNLTSIKTNKPIPVIISKDFGYKRVWNTQLNKNILVLGLEKNKKKDTPINGIIFKVKNNVLKKFIKREKHYKQIYIDSTYVKSYNKSNDIDVNTKIITFVTKLPSKSHLKDNKKLKNENYSKKLYIVPLYLNIIINGLQKYGNKFVSMFFDTTYGFPKSLNTYNKWKKNVNINKTCEILCN